MTNFPKIWNTSITKYPHFWVTYHFVSTIEIRWEIQLFIVLFEWCTHEFESYRCFLWCNLPDIDLFHDVIRSRIGVKNEWMLIGIFQLPGICDCVFSAHKYVWMFLRSADNKFILTNVEFFKCAKINTLNSRGYDCIAFFKDLLAKIEFWANQK